MATTDKLEIVEESLNIDTHRVVTGRIRVSTESQLTEELPQASLSGERVEVTREAIGKQVSVVPQTHVEGDVTIIPVLEEIVVVEQRLMLVEEIRIRKTATTEDVSIRSRFTSNVPRSNDLKTKTQTRRNCHELH